MIRLNMVVEGQTEETFANDVLAPHLATHEVFATARSVESGRRRLGPRQQRVYRGGLLKYAKAKVDLQAWMKQDKSDDARFTTMFDLYALPDDFPGYTEARCCSALCERVGALEQSLAADVGPYRFIPYIQLHEFEALLFAGIGELRAAFPGAEAGISALELIAASFVSPEDIDDGAETAPSKRIIGEVPGYRNAKPAVAPIVAAAIGLPRIRAACPHFDEWLTKLEGLGAAAKEAVP